MSLEQLQQFLNSDQFRQLLRDASAPGWLDMAGTAISAISFAAAAVGVWLVYFQIKADHERSRREYAIDKISFWLEHISHETGSIAAFVDGLSKEQCEALAESRNIGLCQEHRLRLISILKRDFPSIETDWHKDLKSFSLEGQKLRSIRNMAVSYLNALEVICLSFAYSVADRRIILSQFKFIVDEKKGRAALKHLRAALGSSDYPAIQHFLEELKKQNAVDGESGAGPVDAWPFASS